MTLRGSRAAGTAVEGSDWDFGLYYRGGLDPADISALGWPGRVFAPGEWGSIVNGGAWPTVGGARVDLIYRDLDEVLRWTAAEEGRFEIRREVGYGRGTGPGPGAGGRTAPAGVPDPAACEPGQAVVTFALRFAVLRPLFGKANKMSFPFPCQAPPPQSARRSAARPS